MPDSFRYKAFISYSHSDAKWASWLHKALESYRVPKHVQSSAGLRLGVIFRDRDELPTSRDLSAAIQDALDNSESLIVICSETASRSRWVNEEVLRFIDLGREEQIYCLIVDGDIPECFPPALRDREPLASDARKQGDGREIAKLKLISGLLKLGYGELRERDQIRKQRRLAAISAGSILGMLLMGGLAGMAVMAQRNAESEAQTSEQVITFLIELFEVNEPGPDAANQVTARELLDRGVTRIDANLSELPLIKARLMHTMSRVYHELGLYEQAVPLAQIALNTRSELLDRNHPHLQESFDILGTLRFRLGDYSAAEEHYAQKLETTEAVYGNQSEEYADDLSALGAVLSASGRFEESVQNREESIQILENLFGPNHPSTMRDIGNLGVVYLDMGEPAKALPLFTKVVDFSEEEEVDPEYSRLPWALNNLGAAYLDLEEYTQAEPILRRTLTLRESSIGTEHPLLVPTLHNLGILLRHLEHYREGEQYLVRALKIANTSYGSEHPAIAYVLLEYAILLLDEGRNSEADETFQKSLNMSINVFGAAHESVMEIMSEYAVSLRANAREQEAIELESHINH